MESERSYYLMITNQPRQSSNDQFKVLFTWDDILIQLGSKLIQQRYDFTRCGLGNSFSHNHKMKLYMHQQCTDNLSLRKCKTIYSYIKGVHSRYCVVLSEIFPMWFFKHAIKTITRVTIRNKYKVLIKRFDYLLYILMIVEAKVNYFVNCVE